MAEAETLNPDENIFPLPEADEQTEDEIDTGVPESSDGDDNDDDEEEYEDEGPSRLQRFKQWYVRNKKKTIPLTVAIVLGIIFGVPASRYAVLGLVLKKTYSVVVTDAKSNLPVSEVELNYRGKSVKTGSDGKATFKNLPVGKSNLKASKKYYSQYEQPMLVPLNSGADFKVSLNPTGRQVPIKTVNKLTGKPLAGVVLSVADSQVKTDEKGEATIVLPPENSKLEGLVKADGYNDQKVQVVVSHLAVKENTYQLVPSGQLYFLSKRTGRIDVMWANLDGSEPKVFLPAIGTESESDTILLASRDWKYLALKSRRDSGLAKLYLIDTETEKLTEIEGGDSNFALFGWSEHRLIYHTQHNNIGLWQNKQSALRTYDADKKQLSTIEETVGEGTSNLDYANSAIQTVNILSNKIIYTVFWHASSTSSPYLNGKKNTIISIGSDNTNKQILKDFDAQKVNYLSAVQSEVDEIYYRTYTPTDSQFYTYENGKVELDKDMNNEKFDKSYPTFLVSPTAESTLWYEQRDGKNTLFVGDGSGNNGKEIASLSEYSPYGWYSDNYVLVSKGGSELFILPSNGVGTTGQIIKITDYHKPAFNFSGYGYGYGGL